MSSEAFLHVVFQNRLIVLLDLSLRALSNVGSSTYWMEYEVRQRHLCDQSTEILF